MTVHSPFPQTVPQRPRLLGDDWLRAIPKVDLHTHLLGAIRPSTLADLARQHGVALPERSVERVYQYRSFREFLQIVKITSQVVNRRDDFTRVSYELLEDAVLKGQCPHLELFFSPTVHLAHGVGYLTQLDGLTSGIRQAHRDFGISCLLVPCIDRADGVSGAMAMLKEIIAHRCDEVVGIGMNVGESERDPGDFACVYQRAGDAGLRRTAHVCEGNLPMTVAPSMNVRTCIETLGCDRLEHGYQMLCDQETVQRARERGVAFCVSVGTALRAHTAGRLAAIQQMYQAGVKLSLGADDPYLYHTDLDDSWARLFKDAGWRMREARELAMNGVDACWLPPVEKAVLRSCVKGVLDSIELTLQPSIA